MKYDNQLRYASSIVKQYDGRVPLAAWLKDYFRVNKQMGSRDRKTVSEMVYGYYRAGANEFNSVEERILAFINVSPFIPEVKEYFFADGSRIAQSIDTQKIFPFTKHLSEKIDAEKFGASFLVQPDLFLRIRPGYRDVVLDKLQAANIQYNYDDADCISVANNTKIKEVLQINKEAVIQDKSSQKTGHFIGSVKDQLPQEPKVWDCCAASGGKSIMAHDIIQSEDLTVSDIRSSIIHNLQVRFQEAGIRNYSSFVADVTDKSFTVPSSQYDLVIADVPCSGAGTWSRTPEQLLFFKEEKIGYYSRLQQNILENVSSSVKPGGFLLYVTCSVFKEENEDVINSSAIQEKLQLVTSDYLKGYNDKADTLFAALFTCRST